MRIINLGNISIGQNQPVFIIAEIGINHNGDFQTAKEMVMQAINCGADGIKFQFFQAEEFMANKEHTYEYKVNGISKKESMYEMFKRLELSFDNYKELFDLIKKNNRIPIASVADSLSTKQALKLNSSIIKLASEDLINVNLLEYISKIDIPLILSTGMSDKFEIENALSILNKENIALLHCVSLYPATIEELNLKKIEELKQFNNIVGFSDHSEGTLATIIAVSLGAKIIEKHFTLNKNDNGPDHSFSSNPKEFTELILAIRKTEKALGNNELKPSKTEAKIRNSYRRSIVAAKDLQENELITEQKINYKRPGYGLKPYEKGKIIGKKTKTSILKDQMITLKDIK